MAHKSVIITNNC